MPAFIPAFTDLDALFLAIGYLLGSIPFGLLLTRMAGLGDIRAIGSGNIGATNVLRTGSKGLAAATLLLDGGKGAAAVLIALHFGASPELAALGAILGHLFPVWLGFRGGKGVATAFGVWLALAWPIGLLALAVWLIVAFALRYSSVAALTAIVVAPIAAVWLAPGFTALVGAVIAILVIARHHENIARLIAGTESRIKLGSR